MTVAACFRCDWVGEARGRACPRCGAALYRQEGPRVARLPALFRRRREARPVARPERLPAADERVPPSEPSASGPARVLALMAAVAVVAGLVYWRATVHPPAGPTGPRLTGALVYPGRAVDGKERLWRLDLFNGTIAEGPVIPVGLDHLFPSDVAPGWFVFDRGGRAFAVRSIDALATTRPVGTGRLVSWSPGGRILYVAHSSPAAVRTCPRSTGSSIDLVDIDTGRRETLFAEPPSDVCPSIASMGSDTTSVYIARSTTEGSGVYRVGFGDVLHPLLPGYGLIAVSPLGDMLVSPNGPGGPRRGITPGTALFWDGIGGPVPVTGDGEPLFVDGFLAWSQDGSEAVVTGRAAGRAALWLIRTGAGAGPRDAVQLLATNGGTVGAVFGHRVLYLEARGGLFAWVGGGLTQVPLPPGAPTPVGPLAWAP